MSPPLFRLAPNRAIAAALLLLASCRPKAAPAPAVDTATIPKPATRDGSPADARRYDSQSALDATADTGPTRAMLAKTARAIERALCRSAPCCVTQLFDLGRDQKGREQLVVELDGQTECLAPRPRVPHSKEESGDQTETEPPSADRRDGEDCQAAEYHLVVRKNGKLRDVALLAKSCNIEPDYPEAGDTVEVDEKERLLVHFFAGGAGLWGSTHISIGFDPLRRVKFESSSFYRADNQNEKSQSWNWDTFAGTSSWSPIDCKTKRGSQGAPNREPAHRAGQEDERDPRLSVSANLVPEVALPEAFVAGGWRKIALGSCSAPLSYTIHGQPDSPDDASASAVVADNTLFVEVSDDRFVGPGKKWVNDDHLELWVGDFDPWNEECDGDVSAGRMVQWGIRVADGAAFPAHGNPEPLAGVERVKVGRTARFKIPLRGSRFTIVYSDSDDGRKQEQLLATSELRFGNPSTLGESFSVDQADATCIVEKGALRIKRLPLPLQESPITEKLDF